MTTLERAFAVNSPRLTPRQPALTGWVIHIAVVALWVALSLRRAAEPQTTSVGPTVGGLIAAYNEAAVLPVTVRALLDKTNPPRGDRRCRRRVHRRHGGCARPT